MSLAQIVDDSGPIFIPAHAATHDGFREWVKSDDFVDRGRISYLKDQIVIEMPDDFGEVFLPTRALTHAGFRRWVTSDEAPPHRRFSYIDGQVVIEMSPEELETHNKVKVEVSRSISNLSRKIGRGTFYADGTLVTNKKAGLSSEPDATFVLWETLESRRVQFVARKEREGEFIELIGAPDWVLEIVSRTSVRKDTLLLRKIYHRAKIPEYWLITAFSPEIDFQILHWRKTGYAAMPIRDSWRRSPLFACRFRLTRQRDRLGYWEYTLEIDE